MNATPAPPFPPPRDAPSTPPPDGRAGVVSAVLMLAICLGLGLATLWDIARGPDGARAERVAPTPSPARGLGRLPGDLRFYLARRYAGVDEFKQIDAAAKLALFSHASAPQVMAGRGEALFLTAPEAFDTSFGRPFTAEETAGWAATLERLGTAFPEGGPPLILLVAPNRHGVLARDLPRWAPAPDAARRRALLEMARDRLAVPPPDLLALYADSGRDDVYHVTDSHWTERGAAMALDAGLAAAGRDVSTPLDWGTATRPGGDLVRLLGLSEARPETMPVVAGPGGMTCRDSDGRAFAPVIFDPLPRRRFSCAAPGSGAAGRALVFSDSYGMSAVPALARRFGEVTVIRDLETDPAPLVAEIRPDAVFVIVVERALSRLAPDALLAGER